jgi:DNA-binding winged helix-turn-helix (wHTH) protein/TolB-like protein/Flp pilus assembly protein TadD
MRQPPKQVYEFGPFRLDPVERVLYRDGEVVSLTAKIFEILLVFVQNSGRTMEKEEMMREVWPDQFVEEGNLTRNVSTLRKALGESPDDHHYIVTIPGRGYRFVADVREAQVEDARPASVEDNRSAVRRPARRAAIWLLAACVASAALAAAGFYARRSVRSNATVNETAINSIAVLPFKPLGAEGADEYIGLGIADTLITKLSNFKQIAVRPTSAVRRYAARDQDPVAAGRELKVDSVLDGSIQQRGDRVRVTAQLARASDGQVIWSFHCDEQCSDVFTLQDIISTKVAEALAPKLSGEERKLLAKRYTTSVEAYQHYLKGRYFWSRRTDEGLKKGIEYFSQAIDSDPNYALAFAGLADCYAVLNAYGGAQLKEAFPRAEAAAEQALALDENLAEARTTRAYVQYYYKRNWAEAEREFQRALALNPNYATAIHWYAEYLMYMGRFEESIAKFKRAQDLDPLSPIITVQQGLPYYYSRQYERAEEEFRRAQKLEPRFTPLVYMLGSCYEEEGKFEEAVALFQAAMAGYQPSPRMTASLTRIYATTGRRAEARRMLKELIAYADSRRLAPYYIAQIYARLDEKDQAFAWLVRACEERDEQIVTLKVDPKLDGLRSDPRFSELLRSIGLLR